MMHGTLFVGLSKKLVKSSIAARRRACEYLDEEGFTNQGRFGGFADYLSAGGGSSGILQLIRLRQEQPDSFQRYWNPSLSEKAAEGRAARFKMLFPDYRGRIPILRESVPYEGFPDDARIVDDSLYEGLKEGFDEVFEYS